MNVESVRNYALSKTDVEESFPFGESTLVFKTSGKIFLLMSLDEHPLRFNVKCEPERAILLREDHPDVILPGYHMNKKHWNTIVIDGRLSASIIREMIDHSYELVVKKRK